MSRLLFAAARGARVQRQQEAMHSDRTWWEDCAIQWGLDDELRIHPEDEHLQYGPISTALRKEAERNFSGEMIIGDRFSTAAFVDFSTDDDYRLPLEEKDIPLYMLIVSEALADEGL